MSDPLAYLARRAALPFFLAVPPVTRPCPTGDQRSRSH
jgi:hypothetical protein